MMPPMPKKATSAIHIHVVPANPIRRRRAARIYRCHRRIERRIERGCACASLLGGRARKPHRLCVFGRAFTETISARATKAHLLGHRRPALCARPVARTRSTEILLRLHNDILKLQLNELAQSIRARVRFGCDFFKSEAGPPGRASFATSPLPTRRLPTRILRTPLNQV